MELPKIPNLQPVPQFDLHIQFDPASGAVALSGSALSNRVMAYGMLQAAIEALTVHAVQQRFNVEERRIDPATRIVGIPS